MRHFNGLEWYLKREPSNPTMEAIAELRCLFPIFTAEVRGTPWDTADQASEQAHEHRNKQHEADSVGDEQRWSVQVLFQRA
ncbi:hypothetical protein E4U55_000643 [Claviceps digitariae]|nr:hypothetical protein E4U55_000643 [Claviceps digitariae]